MNNNLTELVFILDRSGSMSGLERDTIGGFNSMLHQQKKEQGDALVTTILFDHQLMTLHDRVELNKVPDMTDEQYTVRGSTALLDAVGWSVHHIAQIHHYAREEDRPGKTLFVITTDGMENASRQYDYDTVRRMIEHEREKYGWEFLFLGANIDAAAEAQRFGISSRRAARYEADEEGTRLNFGAVGDVISTIRASAAPCAAAALEDSDDWSADIRGHYRKKNGGR